MDFNPLEIPETKTGLLFTAPGVWAEIVIRMAKTHLPHYDWHIYALSKEHNLPQVSLNKIDLCISFLCPRILPASILDLATLAVNFHPGDRNYPGIGCYNFALYEESAFYGACYHHMKPKVDTGGIISEKRFPILQSDTVETLQFKSYVKLISLVDDFFDKYTQGYDFNSSLKEWSRKPFTRKELNNLCSISDEMDEVEKAKRNKACNYPGFTEGNTSIPLVHSLTLRTS